MRTLRILDKVDTEGWARGPSTSRRVDLRRQERSIHRSGENLVLRQGSAILIDAWHSGKGGRALEKVLASLVRMRVIVIGSVLTLFQEMLQGDISEMVDVLT